MMAQQGSNKTQENELLRSKSFNGKWRDDSETRSQYAQNEILTHFEHPRFCFTLTSAKLVLPLCFARHYPRQSETACVSSAYSRLHQEPPVRSGLERQTNRLN